MESINISMVCGKADTIILLYFGLGTTGQKNYVQFWTPKLMKEKIHEIGWNGYEAYPIRYVGIYLQESQVK